MNVGLPALLAVGCISAGLIVTVLVAMRHRASRRVTRLAQTTQDLQAELKELRDETKSRIVELGNAVDKLKVECATANIRLSSLKPQKSEANRKIAESMQADTWTRSENLIDFPIVPAIAELNDNDTWMRNESEPNVVGPTSSSALLATVFSQGHAFGTSARKTNLKNR